MRSEPALTITKIPNLVSFVLIALAAIAAVCSLTVVHNTRTLVQTWQKVDSGSATRIALLSQLQDDSSYGDMTQRLKNLIQKRDLVHLRLVNAASVNAIRAVAQYQTLGVTIEEQNNLNVLRGAFEAYAAAADIAKGMILAGKVVPEIDNKVRAEDRIAAAALTQLGNELQQARMAGGKTLDTLGQRVIIVSIYSSVGSCLVLTIIAGGFLWFKLYRPGRVDHLTPGYAVVAGQVKTLAVRTVKVIADIDDQIRTMEHAATKAAAAMTKIDGIISNLDAVASAILTQRPSPLVRDIVPKARVRAPQAVENAGDSDDTSRGISSSLVADHKPGGLQSELNQVLMAQSSETDERRRYERVSGKGTSVILRTQDRKIEAVLRDISRGGAAINSDWTAPAGIMVEIELPNVAGPMAARVVRSDGREIGLVFGGDPVNLARVDRALDSLSSRLMAAADRL